MAVVASNHAPARLRAVRLYSKKRYGHRTQTHAETKNRATDCTESGCQRTSTAAAAAAAVVAARSAATAAVAVAAPALEAAAAAAAAAVAVVAAAAAAAAAVAVVAVAAATAAVAVVAVAAAATVAVVAAAAAAAAAAAVAVVAVAAAAVVAVHVAAASASAAQADERCECLCTSSVEQSVKIGKRPRAPNNRIISGAPLLEHGPMLEYLLNRGGLPNVDGARGGDRQTQRWREGCASNAARRLAPAGAGRSVCCKQRSGAAAVQTIQASCQLKRGGVSGALAQATSCCEHARSKPEQNHGNCRSKAI